MLRFLKKKVTEEVKSKDRILQGTSAEQTNIPDKAAEDSGRTGGVAYKC